MSIVILGSGLAGYTLLRELRKRDADVPVTLVTADDGTFYSKPNLSNALAAGRSPEALAGAPAAKMVADLKATILTHTHVTALDPHARTVIAGGRPLAYDRLVLALGADPFAHGLAGDASERVLTVNDLAGYARFRAALDGKRRVAILGGGLIGAEFANDLVASGHAVDVVHLGDWPLERLLPEAAGRRLAESLAGHGVVWHFGRTARAAHSAGGGIALELDDGRVIETELVLSAIGLKPRTELARAAGLPVNRGIVTDRYGQTGAADVYALGDCAEVDGRVLPYVQPIMVQARALAATLTGAPTPIVYPAMPVIVKTPAHPVAVVPPAPGVAGGWDIEDDASGVSARFHDSTGRLAGFALTGGHAGKRQALAKALDT